ncbi:MAG: hypothetical protein PHD95_03845 [Candidatus ainarchaeum sp.]|nr:hypothetical protein [Candidatus ainarchaeum sp.]
MPHVSFHRQPLEAARIRKAVLSGRYTTAAKIQQVLAGQGIGITIGAIKQARRRLTGKGIPAGKIAKTAMARDLLHYDPALTNKEAVEMLEALGVSRQNVKDARHQLHQRAPREGRRLKPLPKLTSRQQMLVRQSLPILRKLIWLKTVSRGLREDYAEEAFLELSSKSPLWIVRLRPGADLEAFLDFKTRNALIDFRIKTLMQGTGLKQIEVRNGLKWLSERSAGKSWAEIARSHNTNPETAMEIATALCDYFRTVQG